MPTFKGTQPLASLLTTKLAESDRFGLRSFSLQRFSRVIVGHLWAETTCGRRLPKVKMTHDADDLWFWMFGCLHNGCGKTRDMSIIMVFDDSLSTLQMWKFIHDKVPDSRGRAGFALLNKLTPRTSLPFALLKYEADLCKRATADFKYFHLWLFCKSCRTLAFVHSLHV